MLEPSSQGCVLLQLGILGIGMSVLLLLMRLAKDDRQTNQIGVIYIEQKYMLIAKGLGSNLVLALHDYRILLGKKNDCDFSF